MQRFGPNSLVRGLVWPLAQRLQIRHQIVNVGIGVLAEQLDMGIHRGIHLVLHVAGPPGTIRPRIVSQPDRKFVEIGQQCR